MFEVSGISGHRVGTTALGDKWRQMSGSGLDAVPAAYRENAGAAVAAAFGHTPVGAIKTLSGGASGALIFRVEVGGRPYLLRVEGVPSPLRNPHQYVSMRMAAEAGIAPRILHVDEERRVAVTDFIAEQQLQAYPGGAGALAQAVGGLLRRLQDTPAFPAFVEYPDIVTKLTAYVARTGLFVPGLLDPHLERLARLWEANPWNDAALVSSHNDINPRNILFDGERLWVIDWESAYRNDPLVDVSIVLDNLAPTAELEDIVLRAWLGRAPDAAVRERLAVMRALTRLYFAGVLLSASATHARETPDGDLSAPSLPEFQDMVRAGRLQSGSRDMVHTMGKMYLASFLNGAPVPPLHDAVAAD